MFYELLEVKLKLFDYILLHLYGFYLRDILLSTQSTFQKIEKQHLKLIATNCIHNDADP